MHTILVTGGTGLVGQGIRLALERTKGDGKQENENWVFLSSKDCDLLYVMKWIRSDRIEIVKLLAQCLKNTSLIM